MENVDITRRKLTINADEAPLTRPHPSIYHDKRVSRAGTAGERCTSPGGLGLATTLRLVGMFHCEASRLVASECDAKVALYR